MIGWSLQALILSFGKHFSTDEFGYAHMAWLLAQGLVPYRDFFDAHPPLFALIHSPVFRLAGDDPHLILFLRGFMLVPLAASLWAAARLSRRGGSVAMLLAPLLMLSAPGYVRWVTEIRPDALAFALFLCAVALLDEESPSLRVRSFLAGALAAAACWTTIKAAIYVAALPALWGICYLRQRRNGLRQNSFLHLGWFLSGAASVSGLLAGDLMRKGALALAWQCCVVWTGQHESGMQGFSWRRDFDPVMRDHSWILVLAILGLLVEGIRARRQRDLPAARALLAVALLPAFLSHAIQRTAYAYNLIPWLGLLAVWAAGGMAWLLKYSSGWLGRLSSILLCAMLLLNWEIKLFNQVGSDNRLQREVLGRIGQLTSPSDCVYDNTGSAVSRPHAYYYFYTDTYLRKTLGSQLAREVPRAVDRQRCVMRVMDLRSALLPAPLLDFLQTHYQPMDGNLALWGQRYAAGRSDRSDREFLAIESGDYFTSPPVKLSIDGKQIATRSFHLERGMHSLHYEGSLPEYYVLWLPRDGQPWVPRPGLPPTFSVLF